MNMNQNFEIRDCNNNEIAKELIREYSTIKGAEQCFVSLNNELADLDLFYKTINYLIELWDINETSEEIIEHFKQIGFTNHR